MTLAGTVKKYLDANIHYFPDIYIRAENWDYWKILDNMKVLGHLKQQVYTDMIVINYIRMYFEGKL